MTLAPSVSYSIKGAVYAGRPGMDESQRWIGEIGPHYIIPSVFHPDVASSVAAAVRDAATINPDR